MDNITAENIGKKARAFKHCEKLLATIDKNGQAEYRGGVQPHPSNRDQCQDETIRYADEHPHSFRYGV